MVPFVLKQETVRNPYIDAGYDETCAFYIRLAGLYPDLYGWKYWFLGTYMNVVCAAYVYFVSAYIIATIISFSYMDIELIGEDLCFGMYTYIYASVSIIFMASRPKIDHVLEMAGRGIFHYERPLTPEELKIRATERERGKNYGRLSCGILVSLGLTQLGLMPGIHGLRGEYSSITNGTAPINKYTPLPVWTPINTDTFATYWISYWCQLIPGCVEFLIINGTCTFFIGCTCVLVGNMKLLISSIGDIVERAIYLYEKNGGKPEKRDILFKNPEFHECLVNCLAENVKHHIAILKFYHNFQNIMGFSIFAIFTGAAVTISAPLYTLIEIAGTGDNDKLLTAGTVMLFHTVVSVFLMSKYCRYGQDFINEAEKMLDAYYNTPWYECNIKFRKTLLIAMSYCQVKLELKAFVVGAPASSATFMDIVKGSYSLCNLLLSTR